MPGYTSEFLELKAAKAWGRDSQEWERLPVWHRGRMLAFVLWEETRDAYRQEYSEAYHKRNTSKNEGDREFRAMKREQQLERRGHAT